MNVSERWTLQTEAGGPPSARPSSFVVRVDVYKQTMRIEYVPEERSLRIRARTSVLRLPIPHAKLALHAPTMGRERANEERGRGEAAGWMYLFRLL